VSENVGFCRTLEEIALEWLKSWSWLLEQGFSSAMGTLAYVKMRPRFLAHGYFTVIVPLSMNVAVSGFFIAPSKLFVHTTQVVLVELDHPASKVTEDRQVT